MILVVGATGQVGGRITRRLLEDGQSVRALVRRESACEALVAAGAEPVFGDLTAPQSLAQALEGIDSVITTATAGQRDGAIERVDLYGNQSLIEAAERAAVKQFVFVSTINSNPASPVPLFRAKAMAEARLRASSLGYTILRCNGFMDVLPPLVVGAPAQEGRPVMLVGEGRRKHAWVAQQDVAAFATAALGHPAAHRQSLLIGGPEALSWRDIVDVFAAVLQRPIRVETAAPGESLPALPPFVGAIMASLETFDSPIDMDATAKTFGVALTPLEAWARSEFVQAPA